jgi:hypothetical protein
MQNGTAAGAAAVLGFGVGGGANQHNTVRPTFWPTAQSLGLVPRQRDCGGAPVKSKLSPTARLTTSLASANLRCFGLAVPSASSAA